MTTINHLDAAAIQANAENNLRVRLVNFPRSRDAIAREMAALEQREPKSAEKHIEWSARVASTRRCT